MVKLVWTAIELADELAQFAGGNQDVAEAGHATKSPALNESPYAGRRHAEQGSGLGQVVGKALGWVSRSGRVKWLAHSEHTVTQITPP